ncbi:MAG: SDR family NAD(P)-dependent oxidoreductase [Propionibacteriaceae bacterium]|jgi:NADP-dependent 3-hydroxy acid dehydrogenase YdfG|nr:SDR family NAD(P)-dependent oxidoreductase [Propionibacteriaceae bacterium]
MAQHPPNPHATTLTADPAVGVNYASLYGWSDPFGEPTPVTRRTDPELKEAAPATERPIAVVTGASSGIGAATARSLAQLGYHVILAARRVDKLNALAAEIRGVPVACDATDPAQVAHLAEVAGKTVNVLVNNAGGALGQDPLERTDLDLYEQMYQRNVMTAARVTQALLPAIRRAAGTIVFVTSVAADAPYEGGAGYCGAKAAERALVRSLRLELNGEPIRVVDISPGLVHTDEFSLTRFAGDQARADAVYAGVPNPLTAEDIADAITWMVTRPPHVNIDHLEIRPVAQAANHKVFRQR